MFIEKLEIERLKKDGTPYKQPKVLLRFKCDHCGTIYEKSPRNTSSVKNKHNVHFCCNPCKYASSRKGGIQNRNMEATNLKRYGHKSVMGNEGVQEKREKIFQERYGISSPLQNPEFLAKKRRTHLERHGHESTFQCEQFRKKREKTWTTKYGVPYVPIDQEIAQARSRAAMSKTPTKWTSQIEDRFYELLLTKYSEVKRQHWVNGWPIDFYVGDIDTYIQVDGVYWHALDCDPMDLLESSRPRDRARLQKWKTDRQQDAWFIEHELCLIRIRDTLIKSDPVAALSTLEIQRV